MWSSRNETSPDLTSSWARREWVDLHFRVNCSFKCLCVLCRNMAWTNLHGLPITRDLTGPCEASVLRHAGMCGAARCCGAVVIYAPNIVFPAPPSRLLSPAVDEDAPVSFNEYLKQNTSFISPSPVASPSTQQGLVFLPLTHFILRSRVSLADTFNWDHCTVLSPVVCSGRIWVWKAPLSTTSCTRTPPSSTWWTRSPTSCCSVWLERCSVPRRSARFYCLLQNTHTWRTVSVGQDVCASVLRLWFAPGHAVIW